jgi:hypothetical protein
MKPLFRHVFLLVFSVLTTPAVYAAESPLSIAGARATLVQDFKQAPVWRRGKLDPYVPDKPLTDPTFSWSAGYLWNHPLVGATEKAVAGDPFPAWTSNSNANADPNGDLIEKLGARAPIKWTGTLDFSVDKMPDDLAETVRPINPNGYIGSSMTSFPYAQKYGVFAMEAKLPIGPGLWPAFWLMPVDKSWPPELDIMEVIGREPTTVYTTLHVKGAKGHERMGHGTKVDVDLSADFHEYAVDWGPKQITWYFDRKPIFSQPTPDSFHQPFYILVNVAVGLPSNWGGAPDVTTKLPATMQVRSIRAWQRPEYEAGI